MLEIREIHTRAELQKFVDFPFELYKDNDYWVGPIRKEEVDTLDWSLNPVFQNALGRYFLAYQDGKIVGRIAALINWIEVKDLKKSKVRFGWFDTIDDLKVSRALLEKVAEVGREHQLSFIEGPVGFSNLDKAGMLVDGFEELNTMITLYNYPYYAKHMEELGFQKLAQWVEYEIQITDFEQSPEKVKKFSQIIMDRYQLKLLDFKSTQELLPYVDQMFVLLGQTYDRLQTFVPVQPYQIKYYKERYFRYIHPEFIKCIADKDDRLIAFAITMPSFSRALKKMNGKLFPFGFLHLLWARYRIRKASFYLIGVHPDFQNKGVTAIIFNEIQKLLNKYNISIVETNPELEENEAIQKLWRNYTNRQHKKRATYTRAVDSLSE
ncbi:MAG: GTP cyclohydrolase [Flavobacteriaceae bacterium]